MRPLLLGLLLLLGAQANAAYAPGTIALYDFEQNLSDTTGTYNAVAVGNVPYTGTGAPHGTYYVGSQNGSSTYVSASALCSAVSGLTNLVVEGYVYWGPGIDEYVWRMETPTGIWGLELRNNSFHSFYGQNNPRVEWSSPNYTGFWYYAIVMGSGGAKAYWAPANALPITATVSTNAGYTTVPSGVTEVRLGPPAGRLLAALDWMRFSSQAGTSYPTVDPAGDIAPPSLMSPYLRNIFSPRLQPWVPR